MLSRARSDKGRPSGFSCGGASKVGTTVEMARIPSIRRSGDVPVGSSDWLNALRHLEHEPRLVRGRRGLQRAAMRLGDLRGDIKTEAEALLAGAVAACVGLEQMLHRLIG